MAFAFNASQYAPLTDEFTAIPHGTYNVQIVNAEEKETQSGGQMIVLTFELLDGKYKGRKIWNNYNTVNANPKAVDIAMRGLSTVCQLVGIPGFDANTFGLLYNKPIALKLGITKDDQTGAERNKVNAYLAYQTPGVGLVPAPPVGQAPRPVAPAPSPVAPPPPMAAPVPPAPPVAAPVAPVAAPPVFQAPVTQVAAPVAAPVFTAPPAPPVAPAPMVPPMIPAPVAPPVAAPVEQAAAVPDWAQS